MKTSKPFDTHSEFTSETQKYLSAGWNLHATGSGKLQGRYGKSTYLEMIVHHAERAGLEAVAIIGPKVQEVTKRQYIVMTRPAPEKSRQCFPTPQEGDFLFLFTDKQGRKVPIFARTVEEADRRAEDVGLSDLSDFRAYALADVTGLLQ